MGVLSECSRQAVWREGDFTPEGADTDGNRDVFCLSGLADYRGAVVKDVAEDFIDFWIVVAVVVQRVCELEAKRLRAVPVIFEDSDKLLQRDKSLLEYVLPDSVQAVSDVWQPCEMDGPEGPPRAMERV